jgi:hypothetical protein
MVVLANSTREILVRCSATIVKSYDTIRGIAQKRRKMLGATTALIRGTRTNWSASSVMSWDTIHGTALKGRMNLEVLMGRNSIHSKRDT